MTEKDASHKDNKPKNQLVEGMRKSKGTGASPVHAGHHGQERADPRSESLPRRAEDDYQVGGLRWPD